MKSKGPASTLSLKYILSAKVITANFYMYPLKLSSMQYGTILYIYKDKVFWGA